MKERWGKIPKIWWSLLDQAVVSAGNFLLNVVIARTLTPQLYGTFTILYLVMVTLNTCQSSLINYWLSIKGSVLASTAFRPLFSAAIVVAGIWSLVFSAVLFLAAALLHAGSLWIPASIAMICWQLQETARRGLICQFRYRSSLFPDAFSYLGQVALVGILRPRDLTSVFLTIAVTSFISFVWQTLLVGVVGLAKRSISECFMDSFVLSRFLLVATGLNMLVIQVPVWTLLANFGKDGVASYQALINLNSVVNPLLFGLNNHLVPLVASAAAKQANLARRIALREGSLVGILILPYTAAVVFWPEIALKMFYGPASGYLVLAPLARWLMLGCLFYYLGTVLNAYESGVGRTASSMYSQAIALTFVCAVGIPTIAYRGVGGAIFICVSALIFKALALLVISAIHERTPLHSHTYCRVQSDSPATPKSCTPAVKEWV